jgi:hypothetical protein
MAGLVAVARAPPPAAVAVFVVALAIRASWFSA